MSNISTKNNVTIKLKDIDTAILSYIKTKIKPLVSQNNNSILVPIIYANPEKWFSIRKEGYIRDEKSNKIQAPIIAVKRTNISKNSNMPFNDMDGNLQVLVSDNYSAENKFNSFDLENNIVSEFKEYKYVNIPKYVDLSYNIIAWTNSTTNMNTIVEDFMYHDKRYWGNDSFRFFVTLDDIPTDVENNIGENRIIKSNFNFNVRAYILPEFFKDKSTTSVKPSVSKVRITEEIVTKI